MQWSSFFWRLSRNYTFYCFDLVLFPFMQLTHNSLPPITTSPNHRPSLDITSNNDVMLWSRIFTFLCLGNTVDSLAVMVAGGLSLRRSPGAGKR